MTDTEPAQPYGHRFIHSSPPLAELREMARDYLLAKLANFTDEDAESVWAALDQQYALEMVTAKVAIAKQHSSEPETSFRGAAAVLTVDLASSKARDGDKLMAMTSLAVSLLGALVSHTGLTAHAALVSLPPSPA